MKVYHHNDLDGKCAAAIALRYAMMVGPAGGFQGIDTIEIDYKDKVKISDIKKCENLIIVDFSFKPEVMNAILMITHNIIWLDHHKTAFEYRYDFPDELAGIRDANFSGCELAWRFFCGDDRPIPRSVQLIGDYDKWSLKFQPECFEFYEGLKMEDTNPKSQTWDRLFEPLEQKTRDGWVESIINQGRNAIIYRDNYCSKICHDFGYEIEFDGHRAFATNFYQFGSKGFGDKMNQYDFCVAYIHDGKRFTISLYSEKVDVSMICQRYGGGGHKGAAGFVCDELPWLKRGL